MNVASTRHMGSVSTRHKERATTRSILRRAPTTDWTDTIRSILETNAVLIEPDTVTETQFRALRDMIHIDMGVPTTLFTERSTVIELCSTLLLSE